MDPDEDWVCSFRNKQGFEKVTPGELNRAISKTIDFVNNKFVDPTSGRTIFTNSRKVITNAQQKAKKKIFFYYVLSQNGIERPELSKKQEFWQSIWDEPERSNRMLKWTTLYKNKPGVLTLQSPAEENKHEQIIKRTYLPQRRKLGTIRWAHQRPQTLEGGREDMI